MLDFFFVVQRVECLVHAHRVAQLGAHVGLLCDLRAAQLLRALQAARVRRDTATRRARLRRTQRARALRGRR